MNWLSLQEDVVDVHGKCAGRLRHWQPRDSTNLLCLSKHWLWQHKVTAGHTDLQRVLLNSQNKCPPSWDFALCPNLKQTEIGEMKLGRQTNVKKNKYQSHKVFSLGKFSGSILCDPRSHCLTRSTYEKVCPISNRAEKSYVEKRSFLLYTGTIWGLYNPYIVAYKKYLKEVTRGFRCSKVLWMVHHD